MKVTYRDICWFVIVALIFFFLSRCHRDELKDQSLAILDKMKADSLSHNAAVLLLEGRIAEEQRKSQEMTAMAQVADAKLAVTDKTINRLTALLKQAKLLPIDTSFVTVSPEYVIYCDSLASESDGLTIEVNKYKNLSAAIIESKNQEIALKDTLINKERLNSLNCRSRFADLQAIYSKVMNDIKPKTQVFIGAEALGTQNTIFQNVGGVISLKTKRNKLWQISSGLQSNGQVYGRINANILITFK